MAGWRAQAVRLHRWIGLTIGIPFTVAAGTGAVLVYQTEIDEAVYGPAAPETTPGRVPVDVAVATAAGARPRATVTEIGFPPARDGVNVYFIELQEGEYIFAEYVDAGSGDRVFWRAPHRYLGLMMTLHSNLALGSVGHGVTKFTAIIGLPLLLFGLCVWWPRGGRWRNGFRVEWRRGAYRLNWDLHKVVGIFAFPLLLVLTLTGVLLFYPSVPDTAGNLVQGPPGSFTVESTPPEDGDETSLPLEDVARTALAHAGGRLVSLHPGTAPSDPIDVQVEVDGRMVHVAVDRYRGAVLATREGEGARLDADLVGRIHAAELDSGVVRALLALASLAGAILLPTGGITWWMRLRRERARARKVGS